MLTLQIREGKDFWWKNSKIGFHRLNGPAITSWYSNGQKKNEEYFVNGNPHRLNGSAYTSWYQNGQKWYEEYYLNGKYHRGNGPAVSFWYKNGQKDFEEYWKNGILKHETEFTSSST